MSPDPTIARRLMLAAAVAGLAVRLAFGFGYWVDKPLTHDEREYLSLASSLRSGRGFTYPPGEPSDPQQFGRAPGYPFFLAVIGAGHGGETSSPARVKFVQAFIGALGVWLIGRIAFRTAGPRAGVAAGAIAAIYPPLVWICAYVFSETLYSMLALASVLLLDLALDRAGKRPGRSGRPIAWAVLSGGASGLSILVRPAMLFFLPAAALWLAARRRARLGIALVIAAVLVVTPWTIRNLRVYHRLVAVASEGGVTFWTGNHPLASGEGDMAANPDIKVADIQFRRAHPGLTPEQLEPLYYRDAVSWIASHPASWLGLLLKKLFYTVIPAGPSYALHSPLYRLSSVVSYLTLLCLAAIGAFRWRRLDHPPEALVPLAASAVLVCVLFFPQERFRIPVLDPALILAASVSFVRQERVRFHSHETIDNR